MVRKRLCQRCRVASTPSIVAYPTVITFAELAELAWLHHCVRNPVSPHPVLNSILYWPGLSVTPSSVVVLISTEGPAGTAGPAPGVSGAAAPGPAGGAPPAR